MPETASPNRIVLKIFNFIWLGVKINGLNSCAKYVLNICGIVPQVSNPTPLLSRPLLKPSQFSRPLFDFKDSRHNCWEIEKTDAELEL